MKLRLLLAALAATFFTASLHAQLSDYDSLKAEGERLFAEKSFAKAREAYAKIVVTNLPPAEQRWVQFRLLDTAWRSEASTQRADTTKLDAARDALDKMVRDIQRTEDKDRVWVEVQESLGDFWWTRRNQQNWGGAWPFYQNALEWWAGARDLETARGRYLGIVWRIERPPGIQARNYYFGNYGNILPLPIAENALKIAQTENDQAHAHYLLARTIQQQGGDWEQRARVPEEFEAAVKLGQKTEWYDDALYQYAEWMMNQGRVVPLKDGGWRNEPDFVKALELFRRLVTEFKKGETRYFEQAQQQIKNITDEQVGVSVSHFFLPDSEVQYHLNWRNVGRIELALYPVALAKDVSLANIDEKRRTDWLTSIDLAGREKLKEWSHDTKDKKDYQPGNASLRLEQKLKPGAYILEARGGGKSARDIVLVTDSALVLKTSGKQALIYFCNALNSSPQREGKVKLWERWHDGKRWQSRESEKEVNADGIAVFELSRPANNNLELFAAAITADRQAFSLGNSYWGRAEFERWKIYAFTDRPAYRPKETVQWKFIARRYNGSVYSTPSDATIEFEITDPRGAKVKADKAKLNPFGSAWGALELTEAMPLGEYQIQFWNEGRKQHIGNAQLFRLEEYKLPEFKVTVQTPEEKTAEGKPRKKAFRLGETVEVSVQADYYFGGAVANASVEVLVYQNPFWMHFPQPRDFPWFYDDMDLAVNRFGRWPGGAGGQIIKRETLKTDATGKAALTFDTPKGGGQDFEYRVEARVTDSSRREITGNGAVRVTQQRYYVFARPDHNLYRPQDKVRIEFTAKDANEQPVVAEGIVKLLREYWWEIWIAPDGREVKGDELKKLQAQQKIWPPAPERPDQKDWRLKFRGYERDEIKTLTVKTDADGKGEFTFTPEREGYYRVTWLSEDVAPKRPPQPIRAETTVWVANNATTEIGYRHGGVEIIADQDTFRVGQRAPVMLVTPTADRYVLFTTEAEELMSYQLVHVTGTVKLVELDIAEQHVPNIFLGAALVTDRQIFTDTKQVVVPPTKNFLTVDVKPDRAQYQPRDEGTLTITTRDHDGKPVAAEVAFGLVDESVFYIQSDYAGDPRQFFYGTKRPHQIQMQATMNWKSYAKLLKGEKDELFDEREADESGKRRRQAGLGGREELESLDRDGLYDGRLEDQFGYANANVLAMDAAAPMEMAAKSMSAVGGMLARGAMPASAPMGANRQLMKGMSDKRSEMQLGEGRASQEPAVVVRSDFRSTILWQPDLKTDAKGTAIVKVKYPDSLTGWKATARAVSVGNQFGLASTNTRTKQPLIVRLQAPRFFVVGDEVVLSAVVNNNTDEAMEVKVTLDSTNVAQASLPAGSGSILLPVDSRQDAAKPAGWKPALLKVPANSEARADWKAIVKSPGEAKLKVTGRGGKFSDAMEKTYVAHEHGIEKFITKAGKVRGNDITVKLDIPQARKPESTTLTVQVTPSLAVTMLDALPYLIDYPYGCTEQTMSRFLPAAITAKTLRDLGLAPEDVMGRVFGGIEPANVKATQPKGKKDLAKLDEMVKAGLERLYDFQHGDGGWGWWKPGDSDRWMTAYVVWGLTLAKQTGVEIKGNVLERGASFLDKTLVEEELNPDMQAWMLHALSLSRERVRSQERHVPQFQAKAFENLWANRERLNAYTRALLALSAHYFSFDETDYKTKAKTLIENLENGVKRDERPDASVLIGGTAPANKGVMGTAHWGEDGVYWRWSDGGVEATAFALRALLTIDPKNPLIEPVTNWLIKNRRGAQWSNTRDTAIVVLAMNDYLKVSGELKPELEFSVFVNGSKVADRKVSGADVFNAPSRFTVDPKLIKDGANEIRIKRNGDGAVYFAAEAKFFSLEEPITPAGNEIFVKREYYKLVGRPTLLKGFVYDKVPLKDGESVKSGERIETVLTVETKNNYEYLLFEDLKPAGFEAVEIRSGESLYAREMKSGAVERKFSAAKPAAAAPQVAPSKKKGGGAARRIGGIAPVGLPRPVLMSDTDFTGRSRWVYQELRDRKVAMFVDKLPEGVWEIRYDFRAEVPGQFHALPVLGHAMYVPEIRCNGAEVRVTVEDAKP
ncbi:MAG: alpha-2-macroglobulin [Verrucomicrobia bacterium]|nr:alpha-2-macroglobulin [Verrucomicrobiota bacterium]